MRKKCDVCGLYRGKKAHSGALHDKIRANRNRVKRGLLGKLRRKG